MLKTPDQVSLENPDIRRNLVCSGTDAASFGLMVGLGETYLPAFALALGMGETSSGLIASLPVVVGGILQLFSMRAMKWLGTEQRWIVACAIVQACAFIPLVIAAIHGTISLPILMVIASVYWTCGLASGPAWNTWMDSIVPATIRANYFSRRSRLQQSCTLVALIASGLMLQTAQSGQWLMIGFATLFTLSSIVRFVSAASLAAHHTDDRLARRAMQQHSGSSAGSIRRSGKRLLVYLVVVQVFVQISGPFFAPYMLKQLEFGYFQYVFLVSVAFLSRIIAVTQWTKIAHHFGAATLMWIGGIALVPLSSMWIVSTNMGWLALTQVCSGIAWAAYELGFFLLFFERIPSQRRTKMLTYYNLGNTIAMFAGASIGAAILTRMDCSREAYYVLFGASGVGRFLALFLLLRANLKPVPIRALARRVLVSQVPVFRVMAIRTEAASFDEPELSSIDSSREAIQKRH
jgi:MFS family permease